MKNHQHSKRSQTVAKVAASCRNVRVVDHTRRRFDGRLQALPKSSDMLSRQLLVRMLLYKAVSTGKVSIGTEPRDCCHRQVVVLGVLLERVVSGIGMKAAPKV